MCFSVSPVFGKMAAEVVAMKKIISAVTALLMLTALMSTVFAESAVTRIKDIAKVQGVRSNQLMGYGLVVGLPGTATLPPFVREGDVPTIGTTPNV